MNETEENKKLVKDFPFLVPYECKDNYDYSFTLLDDIPIGWKKFFGRQMCQDIKDALVEENLLDEFEITQIKEKFGELRLYSNISTKKLNNILFAYEYISSRTCIACGKFGVPIINDGWISPLCESCYNKENKDHHISSEKTYKDFIIDNSSVLNELTIETFHKNGNLIEEIDLIPYYKKLNII